MNDTLIKRESMLLEAIRQGFTCNPQTGEIFGKRGRSLNGKMLGYNYFSISLDGLPKHHIRAHQFIWYWVHKEVVGVIDHINGFKDDNRICNLRSVTTQQNRFNTKAKGFYRYNGGNNFISRIMVDGKDIKLGVFSTKEEASKAYQDAKDIHHKI